MYKHKKRVQNAIPFIGLSSFFLRRWIKTSKRKSGFVSSVCVCVCVRLSGVHQIGSKGWRCQIMHQSGRGEGLKTKNQWEAQIINVIYDETEQASLNHTHWMNASASMRSDSIRKDACFYPDKFKCVFHRVTRETRLRPFVWMCLCSMLLSLGEDMPLILSEC